MIKINLPSDNKVISIGTTSELPKNEEIAISDKFFNILELIEQIADQIGRNDDLEVAHLSFEHRQLLTGLLTLNTQLFALIIYGFWRIPENAQLENELNTILEYYESDLNGNLNDEIITDDLD